jgi:hypothetical protein
LLVARRGLLAELFESGKNDGGGGRHGGLSGIGLRGFDFGDRSWGGFARGIDA